VEGKTDQIIFIKLELNSNSFLKIDTMETFTFHLSGAEHILCIWIKQGDFIGTHSTPLYLHIPKGTVQRTRFPQQMIGDFTEIIIGRLEEGEERIILLESVPKDNVSLLIRSEFCIILSPFLPDRKEHQEKAQIALFSCRLADYMEHIEKYLMNIHIRGPVPTEFDIACFEYEFQDMIQTLYWDIYNHVPSKEQKILLEWCIGMKEFMYKPKGDLDAVLEITRILAHNAICFGTGRVDVL